MHVNEKIKELCLMIERHLLPLIDNNYILCGLPNYSNVGDVLIYQGTVELLKKVKYKCLYKCFYDDYQIPHLREDIVILVMGGGYFGDTWRKAWEPVVEIVSKFPRNRIILLPQSIYYADKHLAENDAKIFQNNKKLVICARDNESFLYAKGVFKNDVLLIPDLAFYMNSKIYKVKSASFQEKTLYLKRQDKEYVNYDIDVNNIDVCDWPTMVPVFQSAHQKLYEILFSNYNSWKIKYPHLQFFIRPFIYNIVFTKYKSLITKTGVNFLSSYNKIYTTRLHVLILGFMMNKEIICLDNSYGKLSSLYNTWLKDQKSITMHN